MRYQSILNQAFDLVVTSLTTALMLRAATTKTTTKTTEL